MPIRKIIRPPLADANGNGAAPPPPPPAAAAAADGDGHGKPSRDDRTGPNWNEDGSYKVGKGKPPRDRCWQPGQSGNPKGSKKKEAPDVETIVGEMMEETIVLTSPSGEKKKVIRAVALARKTYEKGGKGDLKATAFLFDRYAKYLERKAGSAAETGGLSASEEQMLAAMLRSFLGSDEGEPA